MNFFVFIPLFLILIGLILVCFGLKYTLQEDKEDSHVIIRILVNYIGAFLTLPTTKNSILIFVGTVLAMIGFGLLTV